MSDPVAAAFDALFNAHVVVVAGKGGVGKTTVTAVLACAAARAGQRVLVIELDGKATLDRLVGNDQPVEPGTVTVQHLSASRALEEYLVDQGFRRIAKRLVSSGVVEVVGTAAPGIDDLVVLGKVKQLERSRRWDVIIVDGPAAGHAVTMLTSPAGLRDAVGGGPVAQQADDVLAMLGDVERVEVVLVTSPETTPVNELFETAEAVATRTGVRIAGVVVNGLDMTPIPPDPDTVGLTAGIDMDIEAARDAALFRRRRLVVQANERDRVVDRWADTGVRVVGLPERAVAALARGDIDALVDDAVELSRSEEQTS